MPRGWPAWLAMSFVLSPGCAAVVATTETVKVVGKTTYKAAEVTAKAVTWPVREAVKMHQEAHKPGEPPAMVATHHGRTERASAKATGPKTTDDEVELAGASDEEPPVPPLKKSASTARRKAKAEPDLDEADEPPPKSTRTKKVAARPEDEPEPDEAPAPKKKKKANWRTGTKPGEADESDPDTIRIE